MQAFAVHGEMATPTFPKPILLGYYSVFTVCSSMSSHSVQPLYKNVCMLCNQHAQLLAEM